MLSTSKSKPSVQYNTDLDRANIVLYAVCRFRAMMASPNTETE